MDRLHCSCCAPGIPRLLPVDQQVRYWHAAACESQECAYYLGRFNKVVTVALLVSIELPAVEKNVGFLLGDFIFADFANFSVGEPKPLFRHV